MIANSNEGRIPAFAAESEERTQQLAAQLCGLDAIGRQRIIDYDALASRGFYCFANDDPYDGREYRLRAKPNEPRRIDALDEPTRQMLLLHKLPIDAQSSEYFLIDD